MKLRPHHRNKTKVTLLVQRHGKLRSSSTQVAQDEQL